MNITAEDLKSNITEYSLQSDHPDLQVYRRDIDTFHWHRQAWWMAHIAQVGRFYGKKRILDVGCGFGWDAVAISLETGALVVAMDILPSMIDGVQQCLDASKARGRVFNVEPMIGDVCTAPFPDNSLDGIYSSEAVEHVHSLETMYERCYKILKPGARFIIANDSNAYNDEFRARNFAMWPERDESWEHARWLKEEVRPVEHADAKPYSAMREEMIRSVQPNISEEDMKRLVYATAGLAKDELYQAAEAFVSNGTLPVRPELSWCRNPETGEYAERLLDPFAIADGLKAVGFKVSIQHCFRKSPFNLINSIGIRSINKAIFRKKALFILVAEKPV
jgi:SAM-dependent methyltransferase